MKQLALKNKNYIVLSYVIIGCIWVTLSDRITSRLIESMPAHDRATINSFKALFFITFSALLLQYLINLYNNGQKRNLVELKQGLEESRKQQVLINAQNEVLKEIAWINSHEIRRPVASILGLSDLAKKAESQLEKEDYYKMIDACVVELDAIVHQTANKVNGLMSSKEV